MDIGASVCLFGSPSVLSTQHPTHPPTGFKVQPVHLGGMAEGEGLFMLHTYSDVPNAQQVRS